MLSLWKNSFLDITRLISTFQPKGLYVKIALKISFFVHIFEKTNISRKITFFRSFWYNNFLPISPKILTLWGKRQKSFFVHKFVNINICRKITLLSKHFEKVVFYPYIQKYQHFEKNKVFWDNFLKSFWKNPQSF